MSIKQPFLGRWDFLLAFQNDLVGAFELIFEVDFVARVVVGEGRALVGLVADVRVVVVGVEVGLRVAHHLLLGQMARSLDEFGEPVRERNLGHSGTKLNVTVAISWCKKPSSICSFSAVWAHCGHSL